MDTNHFRQKALALAEQIFPTLDGDELVKEADRIFTYMSSNDYQNFIGLSIVTEDTISFAEMLYQDQQQLKLYDYQRDILRNWQTGTDDIVVHARGMGISTLLCIYALWLTSFKNDIHIGFICPTKGAGAELCLKICEFHAQSGFKLSQITKFNRDAIEFLNGNKIRFLSPSTYMVGVSFSHVFADNAASFSYADDENFYSTIMFANSGQSIIASTPGFNVGVFYDMVSSPVLFQNQKTYVSRDAHPKFTKAWEDNTRRTIGHDAYENQYNCQFIEARV